MNTNLLYIPFRQSRPIDLGEELRQVIKSDYFQPPSTFEADLQLITGLRNNITGLKNEQVSLDTEGLLKDYYVYLTSIRKKFPDDCIEFGWYSTLSSFPTGPAKSRSFKIEELNIVYQLGSAYSQLALLESRHTDEGLKNACAYFQLSAGCFEYMLSIMKTESEEQTNPMSIPNDLSITTIECLKQLMLAQAQETIWQKAIGNPTLKDSVIARLSIQTSDYYSLALSNAQVSDFIKLEWINHISIKKYHFKSAANYRMSLVAQDAFQYGEQVAYLRVADDTCKEAQSYKRFVNQFVVEDFEGLTNTVANSLRVAVKENDLVYLKIVPNTRDLKPLVGTSMIKINIPQVLQENPPKDRAIFKALLPHVIIQVSQAFHERRENYIRERFHEPSQALNNMLAKFLADRGLPASIDSIQQPENLPRSIIQHSQEIVSLGGTQIIDQSIQEIVDLATESRRLIDECSGRIELVEEEEEFLKDRHSGYSISITPTKKAANDLIEKINKMSIYLDQAKSGDKVVTAKYQELKPLLDIYCGGYESLIRFVPDSSYIALDGKVSAIISDLRKALNEGSKIEENRREIIAGLEVKVRDNNILPLVLEEYKDNQDKIYDDNGNIKTRAFESLYDRNLQIFREDLKQLEASKNRQIAFENEIDMLNNRFVTEFRSGNDRSQTKRKEVLQTLENVYVKYLDVMSNLNEGSKFYIDFITKGNAVLQECDQFLFQRRLQAREIEQDIFSRLHTNDINPTVSRDIPLHAPEAKGGLLNPNQGIKFD
ncbi:BRO1-like domain-containing protein [Scheffersomyces amazonensis]|uniref:BRO1-like domain-containing protein n=1 Tax=Scheffersomyces amazonensis TaxID=1078765 RepID=UPI00315D91A1